MDFRDAVTAAAQTWVCRNLDTAENINNYFERLTVSRTGVGLPITDVATPIRNIGRILAQCPASGGPYPAPPVNPPPFSGGQCVGTVYALEVDVIRNGTPLTFSDNRVGPIGTPVYENDGTAWRGRWYRPDGTTILWQFDSIGLGFPQPTITDFRIVSVVSGPDDCGDLPTEPGAPPDITYDAPDGTSTTDPVGITIGNPVLQPDGDIVIPVNVTGPNWEIRVDLPGNDQPRLVPPDTPVGNGPCTTDDAPDADVPEGDEPEPPGGDRDIVGCFVVVDDPDVSIRTTQAFPPNAPVLHFPRLGNILFVVQKGNSRGYMNPIPVQTRRAYIPVPDGETAVGVIGAQQNGTNLSITPVYARIANAEEGDD